MSNYPSIYFIACLCLVCLLFVNRQLQAISTPNKAPSLNFFKVRQSNNTSQGYDGNFDIYGLGIRLGIYFQWAGAVLLKWFRGEPEVLRDLLNENGVFLLAIFIASIIFCTVGTDSPHAVDILILLHIFFGSTYIIMFDANVSDSLEKISSFWGILIKYMTTSGMAFFGVWYWFVELDRLPAIPGTGNYGFLFTKVAVRGRVLVFFKFLSILNLFIWHHALIGSILERIVYLKICKDKLKNGNKKQQQQTRGFLEVLKELSVPSPEKWEAIPPDVNIFRQCTRLLFQPRTDTFADELKPYLGDTKARTDSDAIYTLYFSPYAGAIGGQLAGLLDYLVYVACAVTFRTQKHLEEHRGDNPLSEAQEQAIQKFNDFCSHRNQDLTTPPPLPLQEWEKIALFLIGIGPTVIGLLTPKVRLDGNRNLAFEKSFPKMVNATIELAEPSFNKIINGYAKDHLPKLEWHGGSIEFGFLGPFSMPTIIYNSPKKEDTSKKSAPKKKARECLLWAKFKSLLSTFLQFWYVYSAHLFGLSVLVISISAIELIITWNHIYNAYNIKSTGQVIPLIIGAAGLSRVTFQIIISYLTKPKAEDNKGKQSKIATDLIPDDGSNQGGGAIPVMSGAFGHELMPVVRADPGQEEGRISKDCLESEDEIITEA